MMRLASYRIHQSLVEKPLPIQDYWPIEGEKKREEDTLVIDGDMWAEIKKNYNIK